MQETKNILHKYWGHSDFRVLQEDIIDRVLQNEDVMALMPTGGGKSLCFQIPALIKPGICIVISPLVALMEDQVNSLREKGIKAIALTGGIPFSEIDTLLDNCIYGNYKFLYLSPERLEQELVQERIKQMNVNLIAVDEAHCISQWGHDFRPSYRKIKNLRALQPKINVIALTATATAEVVTDICDQLEFRNHSVFRKSFERKNITYSVLEVQDKFHYLQRLLNSGEEAAIVYVRARLATVETATFLEKAGISAEAFHGGLSSKEKSKSLKKWISGKKRVMVATSAFGMGIDKSNVRTVVHLHLPESLESYFQEAGRAGRDEQPARAVVLTNENDKHRLQKMFLSALPDPEFVKLVYRKLVNYFGVAFGEGQDSEYQFNFADFCDAYQLHFLKTYNSLQLLDRGGVLQLSEQFSKKTSIQVIVSHGQVLQYFDRNPRVANLLKTILRTYGGVFEVKAEINLNLISSKLGMELKEASHLLKKAENDGIIDFAYEEHDSKVTFLVPREDDFTINRLTPVIKLQAATKKQKIEEVLRYVQNNTKCRSAQLLEYFGEKEAEACGTCSVCRASKNELTRELAKAINRSLIELLENGPLEARQLTERLPFEEQHIIKVIQLLLEKGALASPSPNFYTLKHL